MSDLSVIYNPSTFIKDVINKKYIHIQDTYGNIKYTVDYVDFTSAIPSGRFLYINRKDESDFKLQFTSSEKVTEALNKFMELIEKLKKGTYTEPIPETQNTVSVPTLDYSEIFSSSNFIRKVIGKDIQIQNSDATKVVYTVDYSTVNTSMINNRFLIIYTSSDDITLQFSNSEEVLLAHNILLETIEQLKDNTYNTINSNVDNIYDPNTFIYEISFDDYTIRLVNNKGEMTSSIVAKQVTTVYVYGNSVIVKTEASDGRGVYYFKNTTDAILGAERLRQAIKTITDKEESSSSNIRYYTEEFEGDTWEIVPDTTFSMSGTSLTYYEFICPDGTSNCLESEKVKRECEGLVEYDGNLETDVLNKITIYFNQSVKGVVSLIGK